MPDNIDTRVSISLDPQVYREIDGYGEDTRVFVDCVINAVSAAQHTLQKAHNLRELAESNPSWTPENRLRIVGEEIEASKQHTLRRFDLADRDLNANIRHTENALSQPLIEQAGRGTLNGEVRAYVSKLDRKDRAAFVAQAIADDDEASVAAILGAQPFLSGLTQVDHDHFTRMYHEKKNPQLVRRLDVMKTFRDRLDRMAPVLNKEFERAVGAKPAVVARLTELEAQTRAAIADLKAERV